MKKLRTAVIGQGRSGRDIHGDYYRSAKNELVEVIAVVELDEPRRERALREYPGCEVFSDYRDLFDRDDIDLVVNASFSDTHYSITKEFLSRGFNVLVEKPFARNYYECRDLINTAARNNVMLAVFHQSLLAPHHTETKKFMESGILGDIKQISIRYNGFARRWDWQTLQMKMGGSVYNTGPHPIGMALDYLGFDDNTRVAYSKLDTALTSGDAEDYAKIILVSPEKPVVDIEISSIDAFCDYCVRVQGTKGTYQCTQSAYKMKYIVDGENPERPVQAETLRREDDTPMYCSESLITHEESGNFTGSAFDSAVVGFYQMVYDRIVNGVPLAIDPADIAKVIRVIETVHAENPLNVIF